MRMLPKPSRYSEALNTALPFILLALIFVAVPETREYTGFLIIWVIGMIVLGVLSAKFESRAVKIVFWVWAIPGMLTFLGTAWALRSP